jgi:hypothetical protein
MYANVLLFPIPSNRMSQRYARVPFLLCKFHAHACSNRLCQRYALCSTFYVYFTHGCGSNCRRLLLAAGLVWLQCDHRVLTATHEFWCNPRRHCCRCPGTGSTWHVMTLHTCLLHSLLLQACSGCSMGTGFAQQHSSTH